MGLFIRSYVRIAISRVYGQNKHLFREGTYVREMLHKAEIKRNQTEKWQNIWGAVYNYDGSQLKVKIYNQRLRFPKFLTSIC